MKTHSQSNFGGLLTLGEVEKNAAIAVLTRRYFAVERWQRVFTQPYMDTAQFAKLIFM